MPRKRRLLPIGQPCHVVNRGNDRRTLFAQDADYHRFIALMAKAKKRYAVRIFGYNLIGQSLSHDSLPDGTLRSFHVHAMAPRSSRLPPSVSVPNRRRRPRLQGKVSGGPGWNGAISFFQRPAVCRSERVGCGIGKTCRRLEMGQLVGATNQRPRVVGSVRP